MTVDSPPAQAPPVPTAPSKKSKTPIIVAIVAIIVVVALIAVYFAVPSLNGSSTKGYFPKNGDYIEYNVTGMASTTGISGTARLDITNVTSTGYDMVITYAGIPGATTQSHHYNSSDSNAVSYEYGVKVDTEKIQTPWGLKSVDKYFERNGTTNMTGYIGTESQLPYRMEFQDDGVLMTLIINSTNIDVIKNGS